MGRKHVIVVESILYKGDAGEHKGRYNQFRCSACKKDFRSRDFTAAERAETPVVDLTEVPLNQFDLPNRP